MSNICWSKLLNYKDFLLFITIYVFGLTIFYSYFLKFINVCWFITSDLISGWNTRKEFILKTSGSLQEDWVKVERKSIGISHDSESMFLNLTKCQRFSMCLVTAEHMLLSTNTHECLDISITMTHKVYTSNEELQVYLNSFRYQDVSSGECLNRATVIRLVMYYESHHVLGCTMIPSLTNTSPLLF